jgi:hypothetical protein
LCRGVPYKSKRIEGLSQPALHAAKPSRVEWNAVHAQGDVFVCCVMFGLIDSTRACSSAFWSSSLAATRRHE